MRTLLPLVCLFAFLASACTSVEAQADYSTDCDFGAYRTFRMAGPPTEAPYGLPSYSTLRGERINRRLAAGLEAKGLREVLGGEADLLVSFQLVGEPRNEVRSTGGYYVGRYERWYGVGWYDNDVYTVNYVLGTLIVDIFDLRREELVWHGWSSVGLYSTRQAEERGNEIIDAVLEIFPPR